ncbi:class I adenylate-forming enzyme family protein [Sphingomonas echinoides]|uniref:Class I adenylate-forming enzyme family protein n=1 Tax=Sphingomonas echinoides TaxID=59803 RepID=A0ABU4PPN6_9SPHN|nr:class I adenylate-forming enzyme family protein [Sphingomonas echinoides]MDX5985092.1 class I adenylate-forming enzyme family protein [Sphingomonas echinoides]
MSEIIATEVSTLGDLVVRSAHEHPERDALVLPGQRATYAQLQAGAVRVARSLAALGVVRGEHVGILIPNCVEYAETLIGIALLGCVAVPMNARHKSAELGFIIRNADLVAIVTSDHPDDPVSFPDVLADAIGVNRPARLMHVALARGAAREGLIGAPQFAALADAVPPEAIERERRAVRVRDPALIIYTSGTTANPKGCVLSHEAVTRGPVERARYRLKVDGKDVTWGAGPLFHIGTLAPFIGSLGVAGTFLTDTYFDAGRALNLMYKEGVTLAWPWFSAIMQGLIAHAEFDAARLDRLRYLFIIAPPTLVDEVQHLLPQTEVIQACGMTETAGIFALCDADETAESRSNTHGRPSPGIDIRIVDPETGADLPDGSLGEILVRGYNVMDQYWAAPEKTAEALTRDGYLHTGDLYTRLPGGSLVFGGRYKDMLKVGGENVAAIEVEAFLATHPAVKTAEVVGRPDVRLDEVPVAFVELHPGHAADAELLIGHCRGRIASYKVPRAVHFVAADDWPMSATKIDKRALRERLKELES